MYNKKAVEIRQRAMLPSKLTMKCLRHSGATELGEADATEDQIASVTGHKSRQMLNIYVKKTKRLAETAQNKRFG
jgi:integrase